jgi:hypothetical protein
LKVVAIARVGDEPDIIEAFVRHHVAIVDRLIVLHDLTHGETLAQLQDLQRAGLPVEVRPPPSPGFRQGRDTLWVGRECAQEGADWILPLDADEFIAVPRPGYLQAALTALAGRIGCWRWRNHAPLRLAAESDKILDNLALTRAEAPPPTFKVALPASIFAAASGAWLAEGHHCVFVGPEDDPERSTLAPMIELKAIRLAHVPIRSPAQLARKAAQAGRALAADRAGLLATAGGHWRSLAPHAEGGWSRVSLATLQALALNYPDVTNLTLPATVHQPVLSV